MPGDQPTITKVVTQLHRKIVARPALLLAHDRHREDNMQSSLKMFVISSQIKRANTIGGITTGKFTLKLFIF